MPPFRLTGFALALSVPQIANELPADISRDRAPPLTGSRHLHAACGGDIYGGLGVFVGVCEDIFIYVFVW